MRIVLTLTVVSLFFMACGSSSSNQNKVVISEFTANANYQMYGNIAPVYGADANAVSCTSTFTENIESSGSGAAIGQCVSSDGNIISTYYAKNIFLNSDELTTLHTCVHNNPLTGIPSNIECSSGTCGTDGTAVSINLGINSKLYSYKVDLGSAGNIPHNLKNIMNCLYSAGMFPNVGPFP